MTVLFLIMPSHRKRIGFLPSEEVHEIIDKLSKANEFSQSKVTGLLVEEALRSRGALNSSFPSQAIDKDNLISNYFEQKSSNNNKNASNSEFYKINRKEFAKNISIMHEFIEYKYFKEIMKQNNNIFND